MTSIRIQGVSRRFGDAVALDDVDLAIESGEIFFLLGPSGCGKTTLLRVVAGLETPDSGTIRIGDRDVTRLSASRREAVMVFQSYALWPHMTVAKNVAFGLSVRGVGRAERESSVRRALEQVRLADLASRKPNQLSGGQQQRVALARALVVEPRVLLLDEPLSNLDAALRVEMRSEIRRLCREARLTALYVTHDQHEAMAIADRVALMRAGRIEQVGSPREIYARPASAFAAAFMGTTNLIEGALRRDADRWLLESDVGSLEVHVPDPVPDDGACAACSIRPEAWILADPAGAGPGLVEGEVASVSFLGERTEYAVRVPAGRTLAVWEAGARRTDRRPGDAVALSVDPRDVVLVPPGGDS